MKSEELVSNNTYRSQINIPSYKLNIGDHLVFVHLTPEGWAQCYRCFGSEKTLIMMKPSELDEVGYVMGIDKALGVDHSVVVLTTKSVLGAEIVLKPGESVLNHAGELFGPSPLSHMSFLSLKNISKHRLEIGDVGISIKAGEEMSMSDKILIDEISKSKIVEDLFAKGLLKINYKGNVDFDAVEEDVCAVCGGETYLYSKEEQYPCPACNKPKKKISIKASSKLGQRKVKFD